VIAVVWRRWCRGSPRYGAHASADCRTDASTTPAAGDRTNDSPGAGADQAAVANSNPAPITLATVDCLFIRFLPTRCGEGHLRRRPSVKEFCSSFRSVKKQTARIAVPFHVFEETEGGLSPPRVLGLYSLLRREVAKLAPLSLLKSSRVPSGSATKRA
jgi:hypothetical protein